MKRIFASRRTRWAAIVILIVLPAMLAAYSVCDSKLPLDEYLRDFVFADCESTTVEPVASDVEGFNKYMKLYKSALEVEKSAYKNI